MTAGPRSLVVDAFLTTIGLRDTRIDPRGFPASIQGFSEMKARVHKMPQGLDGLSNAW